MASPDSTHRFQTRGQVAADISTAVVQLLSEYTGRGPTKARTTIADGHVICLLEDVMLKAERTLVEAGRSDEVLRMRGTFQETMRDDLIGTVERLTGRTVIAFMSSNHVAPDMAAEIFVLAPQTGSGPAMTDRGEERTG